jgi:hypothetical protein
MTISMSLEAWRARATRSVAAALLVLLMCPSGAVLAWSRGGHMVSAAIAYEELAAHDADVLRRLVQIMDAHPDTEEFRNAIGGARGKVRTLRILMEMARWPDDARNGPHDHPTWHYAGRPLLDRREKPPKQPNDAVSGAALQAFALQATLAADPRTPAAERAIAWCWVFHLVGDIHQPLHAADLYSQTFPDGDRGGSRFFVRDPRTQQPITLHAYWDDAAVHSSKESAVVVHARELRKKYPRSQFRELAATATPAQFEQWARESYELARSLAYRDDLPRAASPENAKAPSERYIADSSSAAQRRVTLAGYRLAEVVRALL